MDSGSLFRDGQQELVAGVSIIVEVTELYLYSV